MSAGPATPGGPAPRAPRTGTSCVLPRPAVPAARAAWPGSPSGSLLHPPLHDYLLVAVLGEERLQLAEHITGRRTLWPGRPATCAGPLFRSRNGEGWQGVHRPGWLAAGEPVEDIVIGP